MQAPGRTSIPNGSVGGGIAYTDDQVLGFLDAGGQETWIFDRLDRLGRYQDSLSPYVDRSTAPDVAHDSAAAIKRTLRIRLRGDAPLDPLSDLIRPHYRLAAPDGGWLDFVLGTFLPNLPTRDVQRGVTWLDFTGSDFGQILADKPFTASFAVQAGDRYPDSVRRILADAFGALPLSLLMEAPAPLIPAALGWEADASRIAGINQLLGAIAYKSLWFDELGKARGHPLPDFFVGQLSHTFRQADLAGSGVTPVADWKETPDLARAANIVVVMGEDPRRTAISQSWANISPLSPISTKRWHDKVKVIVDSAIADAPSALARAKAECQKAALVYSERQVLTLPWPLSQDQDLYGLVYSTADEGVVVGRFLEIGWIHRCAVGAGTTHRLLRVLA